MLAVGGDRGVAFMRVEYRVIIRNINTLIGRYQIRVKHPLAKAEK
jgi:hypothetical protein